MSLVDDYKYCEDIIKKNSKTFYKAYSVLPKEKREAVYGVYAFCRISDDLIDEQDDIEGLKKFEEELEAFSRGVVTDKPVWRVLADIFNRYDMDIGPFRDMIIGQYMDVDFKNIETEDELYRYCDYVAGTVGLMILPIIARENYSKLKTTAIDLGRAMQITNILRDIGEDFRNGRVYIPRETMKKYDYTYKDLEMKIVDERFKSLWEYYAFKAEGLYDKVKEKYKLFDEDSVKPVVLSAEYYRKILDKVRENNYDCIDKRAYVTSFEKIRIATRVERILF